MKTKKAQPEELFEDISDLHQIRIDITYEVYNLICQVNCSHFPVEREGLALQAFSIGYLNDLIDEVLRKSLSGINATRSAARKIKIMIEERRLDWTEAEKNFCPQVLEVLNNLTK
jgi:hypothetical protein